MAKYLFSLFFHFFFSIYCCCLLLDFCLPRHAPAKGALAINGNDDYYMHTEIIIINNNHIHL